MTMSSISFASQSVPPILPGKNDYALCLTHPCWHGLSESDAISLDRMTRCPRVRMGDRLYRMNDLFENLYIVQSGCIKTSIVNVAGVEQVTGFYLHGEMFGIDGIVDKRYAATAVALEDGQIYEIPFEQLEKLCLASPDLRHRVLKIASNQIVSSQSTMLIGTVRAEQRLAIFLNNFSVRNSLLGHSAFQFRLPMTRYDIGSYLYLTSECVSRLIAKFKTTGLIEVDKREVRLLDIAALKSLADGSCPLLLNERAA
ncbi:cyclic nucleotide-binding domain-containing protein [Herbaspirillum sp. RV1423]|uniref:cyclic nucleotide-binding domain-containing protein n=1 Tax=Herbaspirillum sp. RV1423 TaxID=1443993 RepID=UPI0009DE04EC|nr:cyclic nucleotide-binding domain-containing protein [Herbaspirillum sp. RV1423]